MQILIIFQRHMVVRKVMAQLRKIYLHFPNSDLIVIKTHPIST